MPEVSGLVTNTVWNTNISEAENKIPKTIGLVTTTVLETEIGEVERKIPNVSGFVKKTDCDAKISDIEEKYFTTFDYKKFAKEIVDAKINEKN